jgi:hypothetical protein
MGAAGRSPEKVPLAALTDWLLKEPRGEQIEHISPDACPLARVGHYRYPASIFKPLSNNFFLCRARGSAWRGESVGLCEVRDFKVLSIQYLTLRSRFSGILKN